MRTEAQELGIELKREGHAFLERAVFTALREFLPRVGLVNVYLRDRGRELGRVICVMAADLVPEGRAVAAACADHPYAAIERVAAPLCRRAAEEIAPRRLPHGPAGDRHAVAVNGEAFDDTG